MDGNATFKNGKTELQVVCGYVGEWTEEASVCSGHLKSSVLNQTFKNLEMSSLQQDTGVQTKGKS